MVFDTAKQNIIILKLAVGENIKTKRAIWVYVNIETKHAIWVYEY